MPSAEHDLKKAKWQALKAWQRGGAAEPLLVEGSIASCLCEGIPLGDRLQMLGRYLLVSLAHHIPYSPAKVWLLRRAGARIGRGVFISPGVVFDPLFPELITIEDDVLLGLGCRLLTHEYTASSFRLGRIQIGKGAVIGAWALVRSGVKIGAGATAGALSFVNKDVPDGATVAGVPARPLCQKEEARR